LKIQNASKTKANEDQVQSKSQTRRNQKTEEKERERESSVPEDVPASVHARRRFRESIFGENAAINRSDRRLSVLHRLRWLDFVDELLL